METISCESFYDTLSDSTQCCTRRARGLPHPIENDTRPTMSEFQAARTPTGSGERIALIHRTHRSYMSSQRRRPSISLSDSGPRPRRTTLLHEGCIPERRRTGRACRLLESARGSSWRSRTGCRAVDGVPVLVRSTVRRSGGRPVGLGLRRAGADSWSSGPPTARSGRGPRWRR